ncbi:MAG: hypothetical protein HY348_10240 [Nitrospira defluvii]|nr:hypothetical protein [Nitrospira defluvii]
MQVKPTWVRLSVFGAVMLVTSCTGKNPGEPCAWQDSGFTATHDCRMGSFCLRSVSCPGGKQVNYSRCVSGQCSLDHPCPPGHLCVRYSENVSYCIPEPVCEEEQRSP